MGYCTPSQVFARDTGRTYSATSKPNTTQVADYIEHTAAELDGILRARGYSAPVATTATSAYVMLEGFNALGAIAMVEQTAPTPGGKRDTAIHLWEEAKKMLACGDLELDAARDASNSAPRFRRSGLDIGFPASPMVPLNFEA